MRRLRRWPVELVVLTAAFSLGALPARIADAATITVPCDVAALNAAFTSANAAATPTTINLAAGCTYTLTAAAVPGSGLPPLSNAAQPTTIHGNGATIRRDSAAPSSGSSP
jgi:autotransporter family porin